MTKFRLCLAVLIVALIAMMFWLNLFQYFSLEFFNEQRDRIQNFVDSNIIISVAMFISLYVAVTALSLPVGIVMSLAGGALFGVVLGTVAVSFAATVGATLAFLVSRFLLQEYVDRHFPAATRIVNEGIEKDGPYYLFSMRLVPVFPYFVINLAMGLTHIGVWTFFWITQISVIPITLVLTNAGEQVALINNPREIISPVVMGSLALIGLFPLVMRKLLNTKKSDADVP